MLEYLPQRSYFSLVILPFLARTQRKFSIGLELKSFLLRKIRDLALGFSCKTTHVNDHLSSEILHKFEDDYKSFILWVLLGTVFTNICPVPWRAKVKVRPGSLTLHLIFNLKSIFMFIFNCSACLCGYKYLKRPVCGSSAWS